MLIILDKDGTLVESTSGNTFVQHPKDQRLLPGVADLVAELHAQGHTLVIASNQGGVAAGHKTLEGAIAEMRYCLKLLPQISKAYFCPDFDGRFCYEVEGRSYARYDRHADGMDFESFRKPSAGMIQLATDPEWGVTASEIFFVGDRAEDSQAAQSAGIRFIDAAEWRQNGIQSLSSSSSSQG